MNTQTQTPSSNTNAQAPIKPANVPDRVAELLKDQPIMEGKKDAQAKPTPPSNNADKAANHKTQSQADDESGLDDGEEAHSADDMAEGDNSADEQTPGDDGETQGDESPSLTLAALAEKLGVDQSELYNVEIQLGGDQVATLGELKDNFKKYNKAVKEYGELTLAKQTHRNEVAETLSTLSRVASMLPPQARTPEFLKGVQEYAKRIEAVENKKLLGVFPEWADPKAYHAARDAVLEAIKPYGLTSYDLGTILDSRWIRFLHDATELRGKFAKANLFGKQIKRSGQSHGTAKPAKSAPSKRSQIKGTRFDSQVDQVAGLLNNF